MRRLSPIRLLTAIGLATLIVLSVGFYMKSAIYPAPSVTVGSPPPGYEEIFWPLRDGSSVHGWHGGAAGPGRPVVLFFHGNGENLATLEWSGIFDRWRDLDVYAVAADYPGYGRSEGSSSEGALIEGGLAALDWTAEAFPDRPLIVAGWSLGAAVAIQVAAGRPDRLDGLVLMSPWTRLIDVASAHAPAFLVRLLVRERYDSLEAAERVACPVLVVHGTEDEIIPVEQGERLAAALGGRARWVSVAGVGHGDLLDRAEVWDEFRALSQTAEQRLGR